MPNTTVWNLAKYLDSEYSCPPREAVIAAYAQDRGDWNTWEYEKRYGHIVRMLLREDHATWVCGDYAAVERL